MEKTYKQTLGMWALATDAGHILHRIGSEDHPEIRRTMVKNPDEWEEVAVADIPPYTKAEYDAKVAELVRQRYTASEEFAIQRKMLNALLPQPAMLTAEDTAEADAEKALAEYADYNAYVEQCKAAAPVAIARSQSQDTALDDNISARLVTLNTN